MKRPLFEKWWKVGGAAGIIAMALFLVPAVLVADEPRFSDSGQDIMAWYVQNGDRWLAAIFVIAIATAFLFLPFLSALTGVLASAEGDPPIWSRVAAVGGVLYVAIQIAALGGEGIVAYLTKDTGAEVARAGMAFSLFLYSLSGLFAGTFLLSASFVIFQKKAFWQWLGWFGLAASIINVIGAAAIFDTPDGFFGVMRTRVAPFVVGVWVVAAGVGMIRIKTAPRVASKSAMTRDATLDGGSAV